VIGVCQRAKLLEPRGDVMALWNRLLARALEPPPSAEVMALHGAAP
jgi:hypothetical protein